MTRIFILHNADGSRHAFDNREILFQTIINQYGPQVRSVAQSITRNTYTLNDMPIAHDEVMPLNDTCLWLGK